MSVPALGIERLAVPVAGGSLAAFRLASGPANRQPALCAHGITSNSHAWIPVARALDGKLPLVAVDLRGRGESNALQGPFGMAAHAADLLATLDFLGVEEGVIVGHSMGAYVAARLAADHPDRVAALVLVDGGLTIPTSGDVDPQVFIDAFLGPAIARLRMTFASREEYHDWWRAHPAFTAGAIADADIAVYADHDLVGDPPNLRSSVAETAVRADANEVLEMGAAAHRLTVPATLLCAPRGLFDDANPMQPLELVEAWAGAAPAERSAVQVRDVNHYSITMSARGAATVADAILAAASR
jgi:pimeloyl-ACP methyl ester carboxylesterase